MRTAMLLMLAVAGCSDPQQSNFEIQAVVAQVRAEDATKKTAEMSAELAKISAEIKELREEQLNLRSRLAVQEKRLAEAPLPQSAPVVNQETRELEDFEERIGRLDPLKQERAKEAADRLSRESGTRQDAIYLEEQIGSNKLSDRFFVKNGEVWGAIREAVE